MRAAFYKGTRPGIAGFYNRVGRAIGHGPYSHCELILSDRSSISSSFMDGGVRRKNIGYSSGGCWDFFELPSGMEDAALVWADTHMGKAYDIWGNIHFAFGIVKDSEDKFFCSESLGLMLGWKDAWKYEPNMAAQRIQDQYKALQMDTPW